MRLAFLRQFTPLGVLLLLSLTVAGCRQATGSAAVTAAIADIQTREEAGSLDPFALDRPLALPQFEAVNLDDEKLRVVATTAIIGDVVSQIGADAIELTTLIRPGQDPHGYTPAARDLTAVSRADVIFINGWGLEEGLLDDLKNIGASAPFVPVSAGVEMLMAGWAPEGQTVDPHTWHSVRNVIQWLGNIESAFSALDPPHAADYQQNASLYRSRLEELEVYVQSIRSSIPPERRILVTNHDSLGYFARDYGFEVIGTVLPAASTLAEPSAGELTDLVSAMQARQTCTLFTETTASDRLAQAIADDLDSCEEVHVVPLYTGSLGPPGSGADNYIDMFRHNVDRIVEGLTP